MNWKCTEKGCTFAVEEADKGKLTAFRDYHMRTRHGSEQIAPAAPRSHGRKGGGGSLDSDGFWDGMIVGSIIGSIFD